MKKIAVTILGGSGYGAGELLRYLSFHPEAEVLEVISTSNVGEKIEGAHPNLSGFFPGLRFSESPKLSQEHSKRVIFSSLPHGTSSEKLLQFFSEELPENTHCIDLSGDLRLHNQMEHEEFYPDVPFRKELRAKFQYLIPELAQNGARISQHIANPGCLATAGAIAVAPLKALGLEGAVVIDAKTGTSGAGRSPQANFHHPRRHGNFEAYKILSHRHEPEIRQATGIAEMMFVPHLLPTARGIFVTAYASLKEPLSKEELLLLYRKRYEHSPFIRFRKTTPSLHEVVGTNFCDLSLEIRGRQVVITAALDNLGKGMAGQAIQNMNLLCGLEQKSGLKVPALGVQ